MAQKVKITQLHPIEGIPEWKVPFSSHVKTRKRARTSPGQALQKSKISKRKSYLDI
jgi:hypothetical protein